MSVVARWHVVCKFGYKQELVTALQVWINTVACKAGVTRDNTRVLTGSVGAKESELQMEITFASISQLDDFFRGISNQGPEHLAWGKNTSELVVSGSNYWEVYRTVAIAFE